MEGVGYPWDWKLDFKSPKSDYFHLILPFFSAKRKTKEKKEEYVSHFPHIHPKRTFSIEVQSLQNEAPSRQATSYKIAPKESRQQEYF